MSKKRRYSICGHADKTNKDFIVFRQNWYNKECPAYTINNLAQECVVNCMKHANQKFGKTFMDTTKEIVPVFNNTLCRTKDCENGKVERVYSFDYMFKNKDRYVGGWLISESKSGVGHANAILKNNKNNLVVLNSLMCENKYPILPQVIKAGKNSLDCGFKLISAFMQLKKGEKVNNEKLKWKSNKSIIDLTDG